MEISEKEVDFMYNHIGKKIKTLAKTMASIGIVISFILGAVIASSRENYTMGLLIALLGGWGSWIGNFLLYGYGQLIDNSDHVVELLKRKQY